MPHWYVEVPLVRRHMLTKLAISFMLTMQRYPRTSMQLRLKPTSSSAVSGCKRSEAFGLRRLCSGNFLKDVSTLFVRLEGLAADVRR